MKFMNRNIVCSLLAGAAGLLFIGNATAATESASGCNMASCCDGMAMPMAANTSTNATPDLLTTCPVSGDKLGEMGDAFVFTYQGQEVKLCCKSCKKKFDKDPEKYMAMIRAADKKTEQK